MTIDMKDLTPKQKEALRKLQRRVNRRGLVYGVKQAITLFVINVGNVTINTLFIKSDNFLFFMSIVAALLVISNLAKWPESQQQFLEIETSKILNDK